LVSLLKCLEKPLYETEVSDKMDCWTNFEPRFEANSDLVSRAIAGMAKDNDSKGWKLDVLENFIDPVIFKKARERGYLDVKYMLYGNKDDGPLSFSINARETGYIYICQTPGDWGKLPDKFRNFWDLDTKVYISDSSSGSSSFNFETEKEKARLIEYKHKSKDTQDICVVSLEKVTAGAHILTIVPTNEKHIIVSVLLIP
jgi:hypothetical protein